MNTILSIFSGGLTGAIIVWLLRTWISSRLKQAIQHEYSQKLETHKAELNTRIQAIQHENQLQQLRTSLFFDHQRNAFAALLEKIAEVNQLWIDKEYQEEEGFTGPVPYEAFEDLRATFYKHQLFFDNACLAAIELVLDSYRDSFPFDDGSGHLHVRDILTAFEAVQFLQPRIAELFQSRIGVITSQFAEREIALLGSIKLLNKYHFEDIDLPVKGSLKLDHRDKSSEAIIKAAMHFEELVEKLEVFETYLKGDGAWLHEAALNIRRYLEILTGQSRQLTQSTQQIVGGPTPVRATTPQDLS